MSKIGEDPGMSYSRNTAPKFLVFLRKVRPRSREQHAKTSPLTEALVVLASVFVILAVAVFVLRELHHH